MSEPILLEQALHGYRDGHELLANSCDLPAEARRALLVLSDLSGDDVAKGFREYLTGYSVPGTDYYAFARTWYAAEMKRPGCVWTHTLLLGAAAQDANVPFATIRQFFRRPTNARDVSGYQRSLVISQTPEEPQRTVPNVPPMLAVELVEAMYDEPDKVVVVLAEAADEFEELVLSIWDQQWSTLRARCSFSTGSLSFRVFEPQPFALQIVPSGRWKQILRGRTEHFVALYQGDRATVESTATASWARAAVSDLYSDDRRLRRFVRQFSEDVPPSRFAFGRLAATFVALEDLRRHRIDLQSVLDDVGAAFPDHQAKALKLSLAGPVSLSDWPDVLEVDRVRALLCTHREESFSFDELDLLARSAGCFLPGSNWHFENLTWLLSTDALDSRGECVRDELVSTAKLPDVVAVFAEDHRVARELISRNKKLLEDPSAWSQAREFQQLCLSQAAVLTDEDRPAAFSAIVRGRTFSLVDEVIELFGENALPQLLTELNEALLLGEDLPAGKWGGPVWRLSSTFSKWLSGLKTALAGPILKELVGISSPPWMLERVAPASLALALRQDTSARQYRDAGTAGLAFALALRTQTEDGARIASRCFEDVHDALLRESLPWFAWNALEPLLPVGGMLGFFDWDNAEKLRRAYTDAFASRHAWPNRLFWDGLTSSYTNGLVQAYCESTEAGHRLLSQR